MIGSLKKAWGAWWARLGTAVGREWSLVAALPLNARLMLCCSSVAVFAMPAIGVFVHAFIMRSTQNINCVMAFQFALYVGLPLAFVLNRFLVGRLNYAQLYGFGIVLCGVIMALMTFLEKLTFGNIIGMGFLMGLATGFHWANRNYLSLVCTNDLNRNFYFGIESFFSCVSSVVVPAAVGTFIAWWSGGEAGAADARCAYRWIACCVLALVVGGASFLMRGAFPAERPVIVINSRFSPLWRKLLLLATLKGTIQIFLMTAPAILIMRVLGGRENALGLVQSVGAVVAAVLMYLIGRVTRPEHRVPMLAFALLLYGFGAAVNAVRYDSLSVLVFMACQLVAQPMMELAYSPILLRVLDVATGNGRQNQFAYIFSHEMGIFSGRLLGASVFILVAVSASGDAAFRYVLAVMALLHVLCWPVASAITKELAADEAEA